MDEELVEAEVPTVGAKLRAAREAKGLALEDIAAQTRIPRRHLESIENSSWDDLPAATYTVGFAKSYASAVGLDRGEIGEQLREEMGGQRFAASTTEVLEAADPARTMPKSLVIGAVAAVILLVLVMSWLSRRSLDQPEESAVEAPADQGPAVPPAVPPPNPAQAQGPVVLTAIAPAWIHVTDQGETLFMGELAPGQSYTVPASATAPLLKAGKPEALKINVGTATAPPIGPAGKVVSGVSLKPADLMQGGAQPSAPAATPAAAPVQRPRATSPAPRRPARAEPIATPPPSPESASEPPPAAPEQ